MAGEERRGRRLKVWNCREMKTGTKKREKKCLGLEEWKKRRWSEREERDGKEEWCGGWDGGR